MGRKDETRDEKQPDFENTDVTITMKGAEWFALVAKAAGKPLSGIGREIANSAGRKLCDQLTAASDRLQKEVA